jgi:hypothetical protein
MKWTLSTGRKSIEIAKGDETTVFEYDVVTMKLLAEELEIRHGMRREDSDKVSGPTVAFLHDYAEALRALGLADCTADAAFRFYNLIATQFVLMTVDLEKQITAITKE